jgi:sugar phosphate permease
MLIGPYSYLAGAIALDFGGKRGSATAAGIIDGVGYLGGVLAGDAFARATVRYGWQGAFLILAVISAASAVVALLFLLQQRAAR